MNLFSLANGAKRSMSMKLSGVLSAMEASVFYRLLLRSMMVKTGGIACYKEISKLILKRWSLRIPNCLI